VIVAGLDGRFDREIDLLRDGTRGEFLVQEMIYEPLALWLVMYFALRPISASNRLWNDPAYLVSKYPVINQHHQDYDADQMPIAGHPNS
jgi:hypothetical protein